MLLRARSITLQCSNFNASELAWADALKINSVQARVRCTPRKLSKLLHRRELLPGAQ